MDNSEGNGIFQVLHSKNTESRGRVPYSQKPGIKGIFSPQESGWSTIVTNYEQRGLSQPNNSFLCAHCPSNPESPWARECSLCGPGGWRGDRGTHAEERSLRASRRTQKAVARHHTGLPPSWSLGSKILNLLYRRFAFSYEKNISSRWHTSVL